MNFTISKGFNPSPAWPPMVPRIPEIDLINDMEYCKVMPCVPRDVKRGDCVFCILRGEDGDAWPMVHQVWEISDASHTNELWFKIGSTGTSVFGWTKEVYGIAKGTDIYQEQYL